MTVASSIMVPRQNSSLSNPLLPLMVASTQAVTKQSFAVLSKNMVTVSMERSANLLMGFTTYVPFLVIPSTRQNSVVPSTQVATVPMAVVAISFTQRMRIKIVRSLVLLSRLHPQAHHRTLVYRHLTRLSHFSLAVERFLISLLLT